MNVFHDNDVGAGQLFEHSWDSHKCASGLQCGFAEELHIADFATVVQFVVERVDEVFGQAHDPHFPSPPGHPFDLVSQGHNNVGVCPDLSANLGALDLNNDLGPVMHDRPMDLRNGRGGKRGAVETRKNLVDASPPLFFQIRLDFSEVDGGHVGLELGELFDENGGDGVGASSDELSQFHERHPGSRKRLGGGFCDLTHVETETWDARAQIPHEPEPDEDALNLCEPAHAPVPHGNASERAYHVAQRAGREDDFDAQQQRDLDNHEPAEEQQEHHDRCEAHFGAGETAVVVNLQDLERLERDRPQAHAHHQGHDCVAKYARTHGYDATDQNTHDYRVQ